MNKTSIKTYGDLLEEKKRLQDRFDMQKIRIKENFSLLKEEMKPAISAYHFVKQLTSPNKKSVVLNSVLELAAEWILKAGLLKKISWPLRVAIPYFIKNFSSNWFANSKNEIVKNIFSKIP